MLSENVVYTQDGRDIQISVDGFTEKDGEGNDQLLLYHVEGEERFSELYAYNLVLFSKNANITPEMVLGKKAQVILKKEANKRYLNGIISEFIQSFSNEYDSVKGKKSDETVVDDLYVYKAVLSPPLGLTQFSQRYRYFHDQSTLEIIANVLKPWGITPDTSFLTNSNYEKLECCGQYGESDFNFISRLMEKEGIYYQFQHPENNDATTLKLIDKNPANEDVIELPFNPSSPKESIYYWEDSTRMGTQRVILNDYNYQNSKNDYNTSKDLKEQWQHKQSTYFEFNGGSRFVLNDNKKSENMTQMGKHLAEIQAERLRSQSCKGYGKTEYHNLEPGTVIRINFNNSSPSNKPDIYIYSIYLTATTSPYDGRLKDDKFTFDCHFQGQDKSIQYRPLERAVVPNITSLQQGIVVRDDGTEAGEISVEPDYVRLPIKFNWDDKDPNSAIDEALIPITEAGETKKYSLRDVMSKTEAADKVAAHPEAKQAFDANKGTIDNYFKSFRCMARLAQPWAGNNFGHCSLPRPGQEVIVAFINGNPNEPVIVGSVYNDKNKCPVDLNIPAYKYASVFRSNTASDNKNEAISDRYYQQNPEKDFGPTSVDIDELMNNKKPQNFSEIAFYDQQAQAMSPEAKKELGELENFGKAAGQFSQVHLPGISTGIMSAFSSSAGEAEEEAEKLGHWFEGVNIYSNHSIQSQATKKQVIKAGEDLEIEAGKSITLKVGDSSISINSDSIILNHDYKLASANYYPESSKGHIPIAPYNSQLMLVNDGVISKGPNIFQEACFINELSNHLGTRCSLAFGDLRMKAMANLEASAGMSIGEAVKLGAQIMKDSADIANGVVDDMVPKNDPRRSAAGVMKGVVGGIAEVVSTGAEIGDGIKEGIDSGNTTGGKIAGATVGNPGILKAVVGVHVLMENLGGLFGALQALTSLGKKSKLEMQAEEAKFNSKEFKLDSNELNIGMTPLAGMDITAMKGAIRGNRSAMRENRGNIAFNQMSIDTNREDIAGNKADVAGNKEDMLEKLVEQYTQVLNATTLIVKEKVLKREAKTLDKVDEKIRDLNIEVINEKITANKSNMDTLQMDFTTQEEKYKAMSANFDTKMTDIKADILKDTEKMLESIQQIKKTQTKVVDQGVKMSNVHE